MMQTLATLSSGRWRGGQRKKRILLKTQIFLYVGEKQYYREGKKKSGNQFIPFAYSITSVWLWAIRTMCSSSSNLHCCVNIFCIFGEKSMGAFGNVYFRRKSLNKRLHIFTSVPKKSIQHMKCLAGSNTHLFVPQQFIEK